MLAQTSPVLIRARLRQADFRDYEQVVIHRIYFWPTGHSPSKCIISYTKIKNSLLFLLFNLNFPRLPFELVYLGSPFLFTQFIFISFASCCSIYTVHMLQCEFSSELIVIWCIPRHSNIRNHKKSSYFLAGAQNCHPAFGKDSI